MLPPKRRLLPGPWLLASSKLDVKLGPPAKLDPPEESPPKCHLTTAKLQRDFDLVALFDESDDVTRLGVKVALADFRPVLHFLHRDIRRLLPSLFGLLAFLVLELPVVHDPTDGWVRTGSDFDEVEVKSTGHAQRVRNRLNTKLVAGRSDKTDFT